MLRMALGVLAIAAVAALILRRVVKSAAGDLGTVSDHWIAQHRREVD